MYAGPTKLVNVGIPHSRIASPKMTEQGVTDQDQMAQMVGCGGAWVLAEAR